MGGKSVYFMRPIGQEGPIKIGCSMWPASRLKSLAIWSPVRLEIIASAPGEHREENTLHYMFSEHRLHGEWFAPAPEILALIEQVKRDGEIPKLPAHPYRHKSGGPKRNVGRVADPAWTRAKSALTFIVSRAERHAYGYFKAQERPQWVRDAIASYSGTFTPPPTPEITEKLKAYAAELRAKPKADRSLRAWDAWRASSQLPNPLVGAPSQAAA